MRFTKTMLPAAMAMAAPASAKTIRVNVGMGSLTFSPDIIQADQGDTIDFHFYPQSHSVAQGDKDKACQPAAGGFFSGFMPTTSGEASSSFQLTVDSTDAMYIYCATDDHCENGMVGVINGDASGLAQYKAAAAMATGSVTPSAVGGGKIVSSSESGSSSSAEGSATSSAGESMTSGGSESMTSGGSESMTSGAAESTSHSATSESMTSGAAESSHSATSSASMTMASGSGESMTSGSGESSSTTMSMVTGAAAGIKRSVAGLLAAAGGVAAVML